MTCTDGRIAPCTPDSNVLARESVNLSRLVLSMKERMKHGRNFRLGLPQKGFNDDDFGLRKELATSRQGCNLMFQVNHEQ